MASYQVEEIAKHVAAILKLIHLPIDDSTKETPERVARFLAEFRQEFDPEELLGEGFATNTHNLVTQTNIPFRMVCEHHLLPALGRAAIGYVPNEKVVGLSKLSRLVDAVGTERPSLQEYITERIANILNDHLHARGVIVTTTAEHSCMACRGVAAPGVMTTVSTIKGVFRDNPAAKAEFFQLIKG